MSRSNSWLEVSLPCCNVFRVRGGLIAEYRVYLDMTPVSAPTQRAA